MFCSSMVGPPSQVKSFSPICILPLPCSLINIWEDEGKVAEYCSIRQSVNVYCPGLPENNHAKISEMTSGLLSTDIKKATTPKLGIWI